MNPRYTYFTSAEIYGILSDMANFERVVKAGVATIGVLGLYLGGLSAVKYEKEAHANQANHIELATRLEDQAAADQIVALALLYGDLMFTIVMIGKDKVLHPQQ